MDNNQDLNAIRRLCRVIRWASAVFVTGLLVIYLVSWMWPIEVGQGHPFMFAPRLAGLPMDIAQKLDFGQRLIIVAISVPYLAALVWAFWRLTHMLRNFEAGDFFSIQTVAHLRAFAGFLFAAKILSLLAMHARVAVVTHVLEMGPRHYKINLSNDDLALLLMCALFFLIARMMEQGRRIAEENKEFV